MNREAEQQALNNFKQDDLSFKKSQYERKVLDFVEAYVKPRDRVGVNANHINRPIITIRSK